MGMWQGLLEGMNQVEAKKTREKELQDARDERAKEFKQQLDVREADYKRSRADTLTDYQMRREDAEKDATTAATAKRTEALLPLVVANIQRDRAAKVVTSAAQKMLDMFGDSKDPKVQVLRENPKVAADLYEKIQERKQAAQAKGLPDLIPEGDALLENVFIARTGDAEYIVPDYASILSTPLETPAQLAEAMAELAADPPSATFVLDSSMYYIPDTQMMSSAGEAFDTRVMETAAADLKALDGDTDKWAKLKATIDSYKSDPAARVELRTKYGQKAFEALVGSNNPVAKTLAGDPSMITFSDLYTAKLELQGIIDSNASAEEKAVAQAKLDQLGGRI